MKNTRIIELSAMIWMTFVIISCTSNKGVDLDTCTRINLNEEYGDVSVFDIFSKIEVFPLEMTDSSILARISEYDIWKDTIYIFDNQQDDIFVFEITGKFIGRLNRRGNGPGEYIRIADMNINRFSGNLEVLSVDGRIIVYDRKNLSFLSQIALPTYFVHSFQNVSQDYDVLYFNSKTDNVLFLYSRKEDKIVASEWKIPEALSFTGFLPLKPFYVYNDSLYLYKGYFGETYLVTSDTTSILRPHHSWDFGDNTFNLDAVLPEKDWRYYDDIYMKGSAKQALGFVPCFENNKFYMMKFRYRNEEKFLFYDKKEKNSKLFHVFKEGFPIYIRFVDNEYGISICEVDYKEKHMNISVLDDENRRRFLSINEESNPFVIRFKFKP